MTSIVLVEDDVLLAKLLKKQLVLDGHLVRHATHAGEAIVLIDTELPDVIILDLLLPASNGLTLLHELQSYDDTAAVPVIICSTLADSVSLDELRPYGVSRIIDKTTMQPSDIAAAVRAVL